MRTLLALVVLTSGVLAHADSPQPATGRARRVEDPPPRVIDDPHHTALPIRPAATRPGSHPARAKVSPEAREALQAMAEAYGRLKAMELAGGVNLAIAAPAGKESHSAAFAAAFLAPNRFRHEMKGDLLLGSTGSRFYAQKTELGLHITGDVPPGRFPMAELPDEFAELLRRQNPSLLAMVSSDPPADLSAGATEVSLLKEQDVDGKPHTAIKIAFSDRDVVLLINPASHLIRRAVVDLARTFKARGRSDVSATLSIDYTTINADPKLAEDQFAWNPPANSRERAAGGAAMDAADAHALVGKAAPDFKLPGLDGKDVALADLKGGVIVLDFWATWCGPCVEALPHLEKIHKELAGGGLKVLALNQQEDKDKVRAFVTAKGLTMPVLLDAGGEVGAKYNVEGIPQTVVIGKDGKVRKVFVGFGPGSEDQLRQEIEAAMK